MIRISETGMNDVVLGHVWGEFVEVIEEIIKLDWNGIVDESCDCWTMSLGWIYSKTGWDMLVLWEKSAKKWIERFEGWKEIFNKEGMIFRKEFVVNGSNWKKEEKVRMALELGKEYYRK